MKIKEELKKKVKNTKEEQKDAVHDSVEETGKVLSDEDLDRVSGGGGFYSYNRDDRLM